MSNNRYSYMKKKDSGNNVTNKKSFLTFGKILIMVGMVNAIITVVLIVKQASFQNILVMLFSTVLWLVSGILLSKLSETSK